MTSWSARSLEVDLGFLASGRWTAEVHRDGPNADRAAVDYVREVKEVAPGQKLRIQLAPGGGWVARLVPR
jgi:alpha-glucosidase